VQNPPAKVSAETIRKALEAGATAAAAAAARQAVRYNPLFL
jgi:hypothetical protein